MQRIDPKPWSRRQFLKNAMALSGSLATPALIQSSALGKDGAVAPSNRIALGFIGIGMMRRGDRLSVDHGVASRLHRPLDGPIAEVGPAQGRVHRRRGSEPAAIPSDASAMAGLAVG